MIFPFNGTDGVYPFDPGFEADGINFLSATFLGSPLTTNVYQFTDTEPCVNHPYAVDNTGTAIQVCGTPGDKFVVLQLPFGSFVPGQPNVTVSVSANLSDYADAGTPLTLQARGGFEFGATPANDFTTDPTILNTFSNYNTNPTVFSIRKSYVGPEGETATGPNFPRQFALAVDIADGQTLDDFVLIDNLDNRINYLSVASSSPTATISEQPSTASPQNPPDNLLELTWTSLTGTTSATDASATFNYFVPELDADLDSIIDPTLGGCVTIPNDISATANWQPIDPRDTLSPLSSDATPNDAQFRACSLVIQKSVAMATDVGPTGYTPGDIVQYTLNFQVSDYFALENIAITDILSDGQRYYPAFNPTLSVNIHGSTTSGSIDTANIQVVDHFTGGSPAVPPIDGTQEIIFDISSELLLRTFSNDGDLIGGCVPLIGGAIDCTGSTATTATLVFRAQIQQEFTDDYLPQNENVDQGDILGNQVTIFAEVLNNSNLSSTGNAVTETSSSGLSILNGVLALKDIRAINGVIGSYSTPKIGPGDTITYRIRFEMPTSDVENLVITDYLPLPVFAATEITTFDPTQDATIPPPGTIKFGAGDTYFALTSIVPTLSTDAIANTFTLDYGSHQTLTEQTSIVELYVTVTASDEPFADGLFLTNQAQSSQGTTNSTTQTATQIVQVELTLPNLRIQKGVIATDSPAAVFDPASVAPASVSAPGSAGFRFGSGINSNNLTTTPIDSNLVGVDAADLVSFAVVIENIGQGINGAYNVAFADTLPSEFIVPSGGLNMTITDGAGNPLAWTPVNALDTYPLFGSGITLDDSLVGSLSAYHATSGSNIAIITYDLEIIGSIDAEVLIENIASLTSYSSSDTGPNFLAVSLSDPAEVTETKIPEIEKNYVGSNHAGSIDPDVVVGEIIEYEVVLTIPEGVMINTLLTDTLDSGLALVGINSITSSTPDLTTDYPGGFAGVASGIVVTNSGRVIEFPFNTLTNINTNNLVDETITINYSAVVLNNNEIYRDRQRNNSAVFTYANGSVSDSADNVVIAEPTLRVTKTPSAANADAGDTVTFTLVIDHNPASDANAYEVELTDVIPSGMTFAGNLNHTAGLAPSVGPSESSGTITASWATFPDDGSSSTISFDVTIDGSVTLGSSIINTASARWTSLPGSILTDQSTYASPSTERTGSTSDPGGSENDYVVSGSGTVTILSANPTKLITSTSESSTGVLSSIERVAVGEIIRYRTYIRIAEATAPNLMFRDMLPTGLQFINDGTAMIAFVANDAGISSSTLIPASIGCDGGSNPDLSFVGNEVNVDSIVPECPLPDTAVSSAEASNNDTYGSGTSVYFKFGNVTNDDRDTDFEYIIVEFNALVLNISTNQAATTRDNTFRLMQNGSIVATSTTGNPNRVRVVEPVVTVSKAVTIAPTDAGDALQYTLTVRNQDTSVNGATAFDINVLDLVPAEAVVGSVVVSTPNGYTDNSSGQSVDILLDFLNKGQQATITINTIVDSVIQPQEIINNIASARWSSLPSTNGTTTNPTGSSTPGASGSSTGERNGNDGVGLLNDYVASSSANTTIGSITIDKLEPSVTTYAIGSTVEYDILITMPEGTANNVVVTDYIPNGMRYSSYQIITSAGGSLSADYAGSIPTPVVTGGASSGDDVSLAFSSITTTADNNSNNNSFIIRLSLTVLNELGLQRNSTLANTAGLVFDNPNAAGVLSVTDSVPVVITVIEPILDISKTASSIPPLVQAGSSVEYEIVVTHNASSNADAYEVVIQDPAQTNLTITNVSVAVTGSIPTPSSTFAGNTVLVPATGSFTLPDDGTYLTITVTATVNAGASETITNTAQATWSSVPQPNTNARTNGSGNYDLSETGATGLNDYSVTDSDNMVSTSNPTISKVVGQTSANHTSDATDPIQVTIGETISYFLRIGIGEGTTSTLRLIDNLAANTAYISHSLVTAAADSFGEMALDFNGTVPAPSCSGCVNGSAGANLQFDFSGVVNNVDANGLNDFFGIRIDVVVLDIPLNDGLPLGTTQFSNTSSLQANLPSGQIVNSNTIDFDIVEPNLTIDKEFDTGVDPDQASPFEFADVQITIENNGSSSAFDVDWLDNLNSIHTGVFLYQNDISALCSAGVTISMSVDDSSSPVLTGQIIELPAGESCTVSFSVQLVGTIDQSVYPQVTNQTRIVEFSSLPNTNSNERTVGPVIASDSITVAVVDLEIDKTDGALESDPGDTLVYNLTITNSGLVEATGIIVSEEVPANTTFEDSLSTTGWVCTPDNSAGSTCIFDLSSHLGTPLAENGGNETIQFAVIIDNPVAPLTTSITNTASVTDDGSKGIDPTPTNNTDTDENLMGNVVDLAIEKTTTASSVSFNTDLVFTLNYENLGTTDATGVEISDTVPDNSVFNPTLSSVGWSCLPDNNPGSICTISVGTVPRNTSGSIEFAVTTADYPPVYSEIYNEASITDDGNNGPDIRPEDNSDDTSVPVLYTNVFDPPSALKTFNDAGLPEIEWKMVWINDGNTVALDVRIIDPIPVNTTYVTASFQCDARGLSTTTLCTFDALNNQVVWEGNIAPDLGGTDEDDSDNEVVLTFRTTVPPTVETLENHAYVYWDDNLNGDIDDDILAGQEPRYSNDPATGEVDDPTTWIRPTLAVTGSSFLVPSVAAVMILITLAAVNIKNYSLLTIGRRRDLSSISERINFRSIKGF